MKGVSVKVTGERGTFWFVCHCLNKDNGAEWLDVMGGGRNHQTMRSFKADRVRLVRIRRPRRS